MHLQTAFADLQPTAAAQTLAPNRLIADIRGKTIHCSERLIHCT